MRIASVVVCFFLCIGTSYSQKIAKLYYNAKWELTSRDSSSYSRICILDTTHNLFLGEVKDFTKEGQLVMRGVYKGGLKEGNFSFFYPTGQLESEGDYKNNKRDGLWKYFHSDGSKRAEVTFTGDNFFVNILYDNTGTQLAKEGTGKWLNEYEWYQLTESIIVTGQFQDGEKVGEWICKSKSGNLLYTEKFKDGVLKKGTLYGDGKGGVAYTKEFPNKFLEPYKLEVTENFLYERGLNRANYSFLRFLPDPHPIVSSDSTTQDDEVYMVIEEPAYPQGGMQTFYNFIAKNLRYPAEARRARVTGKVFVEFVVNRDGSLSDIKVIKGIGYGCDEEVVRVLSMAPNWNPGLQRQKPVRQRMVLPITFYSNW
jgi:TonB family protein